MKQMVWVLVCGVLLLSLLTLPASAAERDGCFSTEQWFTGVFRLSEKAGCSSRQRLQQRHLFSPVTTNYAFSMQAGEQTAYLSGTLANGQTVVREKIVLSSVPRVLDDVFYLPLEDVISALGGVCLVDGTTARVLLLGQDVTYFAGESPVLWNDRAWMPEEEPARPFLWNQAFYLPLSYAIPLFQEGILRTGEYGIVWG